MSKPTSIEFKAIQHIYDNSSHPELKGLDARALTKSTARYYYLLKRDKDWVKSLESLKQKHEQFLPGNTRSSAMPQLAENTASSNLAYRDITIKNQSKTVIYVCIRSQKKIITKANDIKSVTNSQSKGRNFKVGCDVPLEGIGIPIKIGAKVEMGKKDQVKSSEYTARGVEITSSPFIEEQYNPIKPGKTRSFGVQGRIAYISIKPGSINNDNILTDYNTLNSDFVWDGEDLNDINQKDISPPSIYQNDPSHQPQQQQHPVIIYQNDPSPQPQIIQQITYPQSMYQPQQHPDPVTMQQNENPPLCTKRHCCYGGSIIILIIILIIIIIIISK